MDTLHLLMVEDDARLAQLTVKYLAGHGVVTTVVENGSDVVETVKRTHFDAVLLDLMLPGKEGTEVCRELRSFTDIPIVMVTARGEEADRIVGLELGADDYMQKPYSPRELLARVRAHVRRARGLAGPRPSAAITVGPLHLDPGALSATLEGRVLPLTAYEFALLFALAEQPGRVLSREALLERAKGNAEDAFDRSIDVRISRLRGKLGDDPKQPRLLKTVRGAGYLLAVTEAAQAAESTA